MSTPIDIFAEADAKQAARSTKTVQDPRKILVPSHWPELAASLDDSELGEAGKGVQKRATENEEVFFLGDPSFYARLEWFGEFRKEDDLTAWQVALASGEGKTIAVAMVQFSRDAYAGWTEIFERLEATEEIAKLEELKAKSTELLMELQTEVNAALVAS
jgi:hypothetical protein